MTRERMTELVRATAAGLRQGEPPLGHSFLVEHDVSLDEAYDLAEWMATAVEVVLQLDETRAGRRLIVSTIVENATREMK